QPPDLFVAQVAHARRRVDRGCGQGLHSAGAADAVDVREADLHPLVAGEINTGDTCHTVTPSGWPGYRPCRVLRSSSRCVPRSALALLVARVRADDHHATVPADDAALLADLLD